MNKLSLPSLEWALNHLDLEGDGDLFPRPFEIDVIKRNWARLGPELGNTDITNHRWGPFRSVLVPKEELAFRRACQMEPLDALLFAAIIYEVGTKIEARRKPAAQKTIFSYRFSPAADGSIFAKGNPWADFWKASADLGTESGVVAIVDLSDFYNQIYHHVIENQLDESAVPGPHRTAIMKLLQAYTDGISRGIPIGPHASHVLAEMSLIPLDNFICLRGYKFCRFVDDIHLACSSREEAFVAIHEIANFLDSSQKLLLNKQKTEVLTFQQHRQRSEAMQLDNPINDDERKILEVVKRHAGPYSLIGIGALSPAEIKTLRDSDVDGIIESYLNVTRPNYIRLRWFLRRLAQVGVPAGVDYVLKNIRRLYPAIGDAASYLASAAAHYVGKWPIGGDAVLSALKDPIVSSNDYLQMVLLSLFARIAPLDHFDRLVQNFSTYQGAARREVLLAAAVNSSSAPWLTTVKGSFRQMDSWQRRAFLLAIRKLPKDERHFWVRGISAELSPLEKEIARESGVS